MQNWPTYAKFLYVSEILLQRFFVLLPTLKTNRPWSCFGLAKVPAASDERLTNNVVFSCLKDRSNLYTFQMYPNRIRAHIQKALICSREQRDEESVTIHYVYANMCSNCFFSTWDWNSVLRRGRSSGRSIRRNLTVRWLQRHVQHGATKFILPSCSRVWLGCGPSCSLSYSQWKHYSGLQH